MVIPSRARRDAGIEQGDIVEVKPEGDGRIVLIRLVRPDNRPGKVTIRKRKGRHSVASGGRQISTDRVKELLAELP